jgi:hypothetical protein
MRTTFLMCMFLSLPCLHQGYQVMNNVYSTCLQPGVLWLGCNTLTKRRPIVAKFLDRMPTWRSKHATGSKSVSKGKNVPRSMGSYRTAVEFLAVETAILAKYCADLRCHLISNIFQYKPEGRGFDSRLSHRIFQMT